MIRPSPSCRTALSGRVAIADATITDATMSEAMALAAVARALGGRLAALTSAVSRSDLRVDQVVRD